jgi:hypothetical protein
MQTGGSKMRRIKVTFINADGKRQTKTVTAEFLDVAVMKLEMNYGILVKKVIKAEAI